MSKELHVRASGAEGEVMTVNQPDARNGVPEDTPSVLWC